jgi:hypothetical protein
MSQIDCSDVEPYPVASPQWRAVAGDATAGRGQRGQFLPRRELRKRAARRDRNMPATAPRAVAECPRDRSSDDHELTLDLHPQAAIARRIGASARLEMIPSSDISQTCA